MRAVARPDGPPAHYSFRGPELRRLTAEQFADAVATVTGDWHIARPRPAPPNPSPSPPQQPKLRTRLLHLRMPRWRASFCLPVARGCPASSPARRWIPNRTSPSIRYSRLPLPQTAASSRRSSSGQPWPWRHASASTSASGRARQLCARMADRRQQPHPRFWAPDSRSSLYQPRCAGHQHASRGTGEWRNLESLAVARSPENARRVAAGARQPVQPPGERRSLPSSRAPARKSSRSSSGRWLANTACGASTAASASAGPIPYRHLPFTEALLDRRRQSLHRPGQSRSHLDARILHRGRWLSRRR